MWVLGVVRSKGHDIEEGLWMWKKTGAKDSDVGVSI